MHAVTLAIVITWAVFWFGWLVAAVGAKPGRLNWRRGAGVRLAVFVVVLLLLRIRPLRSGVAHSQIGQPWLQGIGLALFVSGLALAVWARVHIGSNWGTPMTQKADPDLVTTGPYRLVRHPIYSGIILGMIGTAVAVSPYWLIIAATLGGFFIYSATVEERYMTERFPQSYPEYKDSTKMLVPFLF